MKIVQGVCVAITIAVPLAGMFWWKFAVDRPDAEHGLKLTKAGRVVMPGLILATLVSTVLGWMDAQAADVEKETQRATFAEFAKYAQGCSNVPEEVAARMQTILGDEVKPIQLIGPTVAPQQPQPPDFGCSPTAPPFQRGAAQARLAVSKTPDDATSRLRVLRDLLSRTGGSEWNKWLDDVEGTDGEEDVTVVVANNVQPHAIEAICDWLTRCQGWNTASTFKCEVRPHGY